MVGSVVSDSTSEWLLRQRERTGRGQIVEVSMHDTIYPMLASSLGALHNHPDRELPERTGKRILSRMRSHGVFEPGCGAHGAHRARPTAVPAPAPRSGRNVPQSARQVSAQPTTASDEH